MAAKVVEADRVEVIVRVEDVRGAQIAVDEDVVMGDAVSTVRLNQIIALVANQIVLEMTDRDIS